MIDDFMAGGRSGAKIGQVIGEVIGILSRPVALITQIFYRKDMGERFFLPWHTAVGGLLLVGAYYGSIELTHGTTEGVRDAFGRTATREVPAYTSLFVLRVATGAWIGILILAGYEHRWRTVRRYREGKKWHSMCGGVPRLKGLTNAAQYAGTVALAVATWYIRLPVFTGVLGASLCFGILADEAAAKAFWYRVLDVVDGQLEAEHLGAAVENRLRPTQVEGVSAFVPAYVSPGGRTKIAEAFERHRTLRVTTATVTPSMHPADSLEAKLIKQAEEMVRSDLQ